MSTAATPAVRAEGLSKRYGEFRALKGLSLSIQPGELYGFLGPNGAGKTTTITILTGQQPPDDGRAEVLGVDPAADPVGVRRRIGVLPEREDPPSFLTPREYFEFVATIRNLEVETAIDRALEYAASLGFESKLDTLTADLSRGQRQKVMITQAFLHDPDLVFIDEPLANLDPIVQERVKALLAEYVEDGNTVFLSTHYIDVVESICTRVGVLREGRLVADRRPEDLAPGESFLDAFETATASEL